jgi:hypothetical protein
MGVVTANFVYFHKQFTTCSWAFDWCILYDRQLTCCVEAHTVFPLQMEFTLTAKKLEKILYVVNKYGMPL